MAHGLYCGYPGGLDAIGKAMGLPQDRQKLATGKALIRYFCVPCRPTKSNGNRTWNLPKHVPEKWQLFKEYCKQDVTAENSILRRLDQYPVPAEEERLWQMDVKMNAFGVRVDEELTDGALYIDCLLYTSSYTLDDLARAGMTLRDSGRQADLQGLLKTFGVEALPALPKEQYGAFATALRGMGAQI